MNDNRNYCGNFKNCAPTTTCEKMPNAFPPQHQNKQPGLEYIMRPVPVSECNRQCRKLEGKTAIITGGDSGIGRAVAYDFVREGASVAIVYYDEDKDAEDTAERIKQLGGCCLLIKGDLKNPQFARECVQKTIDRFGGLDVLVNNHAFQFVQRSILDISHKQLEFIFRNNVFSFFYMIQYALPFMKKGGSIINTASVTAFQGNKDLIDYSATKGAIVTVLNVPISLLHLQDLMLPLSNQVNFQVLKTKYQSVDRLTSAELYGLQLIVLLSATLFYRNIINPSKPEENTI